MCRNFRSIKWNQKTYHKNSWDYPYKGVVYSFGEVVCYADENFWFIRLSNGCDLPGGLKLFYLLGYKVIFS
jgi:hypothetical protein